MRKYKTVCSRFVIILFCSLNLIRCDHTSKETQEITFTDEGEYTLGCVLSKKSETEFKKEYCEEKVKVGIWKEYLNSSNVFYRKGEYLPFLLDIEPFHFQNINGNVGVATYDNHIYPKNGKWDYYDYDNNYIFSEYYWNNNLYFVKDIDSTIEYALKVFPSKLFLVIDRNDSLIIEWYHGFNNVTNNYRDYNVTDSVEWLLKDSLTNEKLISRLFIDSVDGKYKIVNEISVYNKSLLIDKISW